MRAVAVVEPNKVALVELGKPTPGPYQALVKNDVAALCNATDGKLVAGHFAGVDQYPIIIGHECTGIVEAVGPKVRNVAPGDRVIGGLLFEFSDPRYASGWGGFCEYNVVNDHEAMVADKVADAEHGWFECYEIQTKVDPGVSAADAVLMCMWREVHGGFGDFHLQPGDDILVFGAGPVGLSFTKFAKLLGLGWVGVIDPLPNKRETALKMGADAAFAPGDSALNAFIEKRGKKLDAVIDAVGRAELINAALPLIKLGGTIAVYGVVPKGPLTVEKDSGPFNFNLFVHQWPTRHRERTAQKPLTDWVKEGRLSAKEFVTHEFPIEKINDALDEVKKGTVLKCLLSF